MHVCTISSYERLLVIDFSSSRHTSRCPYDFGIDYNHGWTNGALPTGADRDPNLDFKGCPDRDDDGIPDILDACPDQAGGSCYSGCPNSKGADYDTDRDGIVDCLDRCPNTYAVGTLDGCRDRDFDGVPDSRDYCMTTPGSASFTFQRSVEGNAEKALTIVGCPDTDGDLVPDPADLCNAPAYPNQGLTVDGIVQSGDAVVDKSGCPADSDKVSQVRMRRVMCYARASFLHFSHSFLHCLGSILTTLTLSTFTLGWSF